jgi:exosortase
MKADSQGTDAPPNRLTSAPSTFLIPPSSVLRLLSAIRGRADILTISALWLWMCYLLAPQWSFYENYHYGWAVPGLATYLFWRRWMTRPAPSQPTARLLARGALTAMIGLLVPGRLLYEVSALSRSACVPLVFAISAITLGGFYLVGGRGWLRHLTFPVLFFLLAVPWPGSLESWVIAPLTQLNASTIAEALTLGGLPAIQVGNVIEISAGTVGIDEACSGIRSFQATLMISLFLGELYRLRAHVRGVLVAAGIGLALACNLARTFILTWLSDQKGVDSMHRWHDGVGVGVLLTCFIGLWSVGQVVRSRCSVS